MLKNRKSISAFAVVAFLLLSISAPALSTAAKTPPVQLKSPQNIVVTPTFPIGNFTVSWNSAPSASSYTVRVYNSSGKTLVGPTIALAVSVLTVTKSANTSYRVTVQAIGNGTTYSNSPESGKYSLTTFASTYAITWNDSCPDGINTCTTSSSGGASTYVITSAVTTIPTTAPAAVGYSFGGWFTQTAGAGTQLTNSSYTPASPYGAKTFYAKWTANTDNAITWDHNGGASVTTGPATYTTGLTIASLPVTTTKAGYTFDGWWVDSTFATGSAITSSHTPASPYGAITFFAKWTANTDNAITWDHNGGASVTTGPATYTTGLTIVSLPVTTTKAGYTFDGWWVDLTFATGSAITSSYTPSTPYGAITFYAKWTTNTDNAITWDDQSATTASSGASSVYTTAAAVATIPTVAPLKSGNSFGGWFTQTAGAGTQVTNASYTPSTPYGAITFYAKWTANTNNAISWDDQSATTASSGGSGVYTTGLSVATIPTVAPLKSGNSFSGWFTQTAGAGTQVTNGSYTPASPYGAITFYAKWSAASASYSIGAIGPGGGRIFYYSEAGFLCGPTQAALCHYLEAAPITWSGPAAGYGSTSDPDVTWATGSNQSNSVTNETATDIGSGYKNSLEILGQIGNVAASSAAVAARAYIGNSLNDWYLPSKAELNELCKYARGRVTGDPTILCSGGSKITGFANDYWSSSEGDALNAWSQRFDDGVVIGVTGTTKAAQYRVRPIRAFGDPVTPFTSSPTYALSASPTVGSPVTATPTGSWSPSSPTLHYQWMRSDNGTTGWSDVTTNSDSSSYTPVSGDVGKYLEVVVTASAAGYANSVVTSSPSAVAVAAVTTQTYAIGDTGPGGGIIYYYNSAGFNCGAGFTSTGSPTGGLCHYLEVAPSGWNTGADPIKVWAVPANTGSGISGIADDSSAYNNALGIGLGYKNSDLIVTQNGAYNASSNNYAAGAARTYTGGSMNDWYLPTTAELNLLCQWDRGVAPSVTTACGGGSLNSGTGATGAGFVENVYWSSSEFDANFAWFQYFGDGLQYFSGKSETYYVRPIRAF
jgi:uncharacterized repeat protein (TIGR02543 family)